MSKLNWANRHNPGEFDVSAPEQVKYDFDHRRCLEPGKPSWPEKFGPSVIGKAWKAGLVVVAEIEGFPHPVAVAEARWGAVGVLLVKTLEGLRVPERIYTRPDARGLTSSGLLMEKD